jgi:hypothetical protein
VRLVRAAFREMSPMSDDGYRRDMWWGQRLSELPNARSGKVLAVLAAVVILVVMVSVWASYLLVQHHNRKRFDATLAIIQGLLALPDQSPPDAQFDRVRQFIHRNSRHGSGVEFRSMLGNKNLVAEQMIAYATGRRDSEPVELLCGARSNMMSATLEKLGYQTRIVNLFDTDNDGLRSHTFLEVKNPETGIWETQDPDYDLYWIDKNSGARVSLAESAEKLSNLEPCHQASACGWNLRDDEGKSASKLRDYLDIVCVENKEEGKRFCLFTTRAKIDRIFNRNGQRGLFCDLMPSRCRDGFRQALALQP